MKGLKPGDRVAANCITFVEIAGFAGGDSSTTASRAAGSLAAVSMDARRNMCAFPLRKWGLPKFLIQ